MQRWSLEQDAAGRSVIWHNALPRFSASWTSGAAQAAAPDEPVWSSAGSEAGDDGIYLSGIEWIDTQPEGNAVGRLMREAGAVIDDWISKRL